jgi:hypothetical protein
MKRAERIRFFMVAAFCSLMVFIRTSYNFFKGNAIGPGK